MYLFIFELEARCYIKKRDTVQVVWEHYIEKKLQGNGEKKYTKKTPKQHHVHGTFTTMD